jgi:glycosyltransferase involved in cell wall biosynthesis
VRGVIQLKKIFQAGRFDVVNTHSRQDTLIAATAARLAKVPLIVRTRHLASPVNSLLTYTWLPNRVTTVSHYVRRQLIERGVPADHVQAIYTPVVLTPRLAHSSLRDELKLAAEAILVGCVAVLRPNKGHLELINAMLPLLRTRPTLHLVLAGGGSPGFEQLQAHIRGSGLSERIHLLGTRRDVPNVLAVNPAVPARNVQELIAWIRTQRGGVSYGSSGVGSSNHLAGELFRMRTGLDMTHVPYRGGGPAMADLIGGTIPMAIMNLPTLIPPAEAGRVRLLGVGTATRVSLKPDLPTIQEQGVADYAVRSWTGAFLQRGTPRAIIETLSAAFKEALETPLARTRLRDIGSEPLFMDPAATDAFVREEYTRWGPVVRAANIRIE